MTTNLLLIRHAATDWADKRLSGWLPGIHLNDDGRAQAERLVHRLAAVPFVAIYSSPLERALETAQPLAEAKGQAVQVRQGLIEVGCGEWAGRTIDELKKEEIWPVLAAYPGGARFPGGESLREAQARIVAEIDGIRAECEGQTVAVVSHADPIRMAAAYYAGIPFDLYHRLMVSPASLTVFAFERFGPHLFCLNLVDELPAFPGAGDSQPRPADG